MSRQSELSKMCKLAERLTQLVNECKERAKNYKPNNIGYGEG